MSSTKAKLVAKKHESEGTPSYGDAVRACSEGIVAEYKQYASDTRQRLLEAKRGSKQWWSLCRELLRQRTRVQGIPALKSEEGNWVHDSKAKTDLLASHFNGKNVIPNAVINEYTAVDNLHQQQREQ